MTINDASVWSRLYQGRTSIDFYGRRKRGFYFSLFLVVVSVVSLFGRGLNLGLDFEGGVAWQVPVTDSLDTDELRSVLESNGIDTANAKIQRLSSGSEDLLRAQVGDQSIEVRQAVQASLASAAGVEASEVSVSSVSSSWGRSITEKAVRALIVFLVLVALYIAWRFEWRMALAAIVAMAHDVLVSVGLYSVFDFEVTPATIVAFLTILGYSLYDTIVVFDKVDDNIERYANARVPVADIVNASTNQVLMRSVNTSIAAVLPVLALLVLGSEILGAIALREFAVALLVGIGTGAYSSIFIATPLLAVLKEREPRFAGLRGSHRTGTDLAQLVITGATTSGRNRSAARAETLTGDSEPTLSPSSSAASVLSHPPRPRKKRRR